MNGPYAVCALLRAERDDGAMAECWREDSGSFVVRDRADFLPRLLRALADTRVDYCALEAVLRDSFDVARFAHTANITSEESGLRVQVTTDPRYAGFLDRARWRTVLGFEIAGSVPVALAIVAVGARHGWLDDAGAVLVFARDHVDPVARMTPRIRRGRSRHAAPAADRRGLAELFRYRLTNQRAKLLLVHATCNST
jgi:hypothetical protein